VAKKLLKLSTLLGVVLVIFLLAGCPSTQPKFTLEVSTEGQGDVVLSSEGPYVKDTEVTLTADPDEGWKFIEWSGDLSGSDNPETLVMDEDKSVTAHFEEKAPKPTITFVDVPEGVCGGDEFEAVVEVLNADEVNFILQRGTETPIEPEVEQDGNTYTLTFESPELESDKVYELIVKASNEDEETVDSVYIIIYETDKTPPQTPTMSFIGGMPACDATSVVLQFGVCDETAIDVSSLRFEVSHGEFEVTVSPEVSEECLTNGEVEWEFGDVDCEELEITMFISDKCGNEASRTRTIDSIDNVKPVVEFERDEGACNDEEEVINWTVYENCLDGFEIFTCCEAVDVEYSEWETEEVVGGRDINTGTATLTFNDPVDCTDYDFTITASDTCGNTNSNQELTIHKDFTEPDIIAYGFMSESLFTSNLSSLEAQLRTLAASATNITTIEGIAPECNAEKAYFVWLAEDDCIESTEIVYDNICRTGEKVEDISGGTAVGYQRIDLDCVTDCEEIGGELTVSDGCNESTEEATTMIDNLEPAVDWGVEDFACGDTETTITWDATDGSGNVHVFLEVSDGTLDTDYSTDAMGEVTWTFEDVDCKDLTATITVFDDCDDCWDCSGLGTCEGNNFEDSETVKVDNMEPLVETLDGTLTGDTGLCNYTGASFSFAATENCVEDFYVEYEIIGEDASETGEFRDLTSDATLLEGETREYTTFEGTMELPAYDGATIVATAFVEDECHTASVTLIDDYFDNVAPAPDSEIIPVNRDCMKFGDELVFSTLVTDNNLVDATVTWDGADASFTLVDDPSLEATYFSYDATLTIDATNIDETFTITMTATDECGNTTVETFDFTVDSIAPELSEHAFNAGTDKLWFWLTEDIEIADPTKGATVVIYVWTDDSIDPSEFVPEDGNPPLIGSWNKIIQGNSKDFYDNENEPIYYQSELNSGEAIWMEDILIADLEHEKMSYNLQDDVWYAFVLEGIQDTCGNENELSDYSKAWSYSPEF
jgi:hypothetical protein